MSLQLAEIRPNCGNCGEPIEIGAMFGVVDDGIYHWHHCRTNAIVHHIDTNKLSVSQIQAIYQVSDRQAKRFIARTNGAKATRKKKLNKVKTNDC